MSPVTLLPFIVLIGAMFLMTRSAKKKQQAAAQMRSDMQPGTGVRTIGGMYATVKEVHDEMVVLEVAPGVHAVYAKNSIGAVLHDEEYNRIVHGEEPISDDAVVPDDASSLIDADDAVAKIDLGKRPESDDAAADEPEDRKAAAEPAEVKASEAKVADATETKDAKTDGESGTK